MSKKTVTPTRFKYYGEKDFQSDISFIGEFYTDDNRFKITLYRVDLNKSKVDNIYNETKAKDKKFMVPVELAIAINSFVVEQNFLGKGGVFNEKIDEFMFSILNDEIESKNIKINKGDFLKYNDGSRERFFEINKVTNIQSDNTIAGFKPYFTKIECKMVKNNIVID